MPAPQRPSRAVSFRSFLPLATRLPRLAACLGFLALAGCASQPQQTAGLSAGSGNLVRDLYLSRTQSDPLGAWLQNDDRLAINYPDTDVYPSSRGTGGMVATAMEFLGVKYRYGGKGPQQGFDCSGLVAYAAEKSLGLKLPRTAHGQAQQGTAVPRKNLRRGDLVFFNTLGRKFSHVGIYLGDQKFVHAPRTGARIRVDSLNGSYWQKRFTGARRLAPQNTSTARR